MYVVAWDTCAYSGGEGKGNWKVSGSYMTYENIDLLQSLLDTLPNAAGKGKLGCSISIGLNLVLRANLRSLQEALSTGVYVAAAELILQ